MYNLLYIKSLKRLLFPLTFFACGVFLVCDLLFGTDSFGEFLSHVSHAVTITTIIGSFYIITLWRFNPFEIMPVLKDYYHGEITYVWEGNKRTKVIKVYVVQTLINLKIRLVTENNTSTNITSSLVWENGEIVLYYTYVTNPSFLEKDNPIQFGSCRMAIQDLQKIQGQYWTSRCTAGDITWLASEPSKNPVRVEAKKSLLSRNKRPV